jgi:hypothetical protein
VKNKRAFLACATVLTGLLASSCQSGRSLHLFNNTGGVIVVTTSTSGYSQTDKIDDKRSATFRWPELLSIRSGTNDWKYSLPLLSSDYFESSRFGYHLYVQVQKDGTLHVMAGDASGVVTNFLSQPPGFPRIPGAAP